MWFHVAYYCSMAAATLADPDGATADADKPVIACHVFDSPKPTFRGGAVGSGGQQLGDSMVGAGLLFGDDFCDVADGKPRTRQSPGIPLVVTGKPTFVERAPAGGASRLRLRGRGPVGAVRKRRVRYKSRPWEGASMTWRYLALSKSIPPPPRHCSSRDGGWRARRRIGHGEPWLVQERNPSLFLRWRLACRKRI